MEVLDCVKFCGIKGAMTFTELFHMQITGPETGRKWVFLHGLMGFGANWRKVVSALEPTERVLVYDQRGHGRSQKPPSGYAPEDYSGDLWKITEELGWQQFILVGHSMGGRNALNFAHRFPQKVMKLVVEDIGPEASPNAVDYYKMLLDAVPTPFASRDEARAFFQNQFRQKLQTRENIEVLAQFFYANMEDKPDGSVNWRFSKEAILESVEAGRREDRWDEVQQLRVPTLWVHGEKSKELSRENFEKVLQCNPMITGVEIPNAGHWVHSEQPHAFTKALQDFVGGF